MKDNKSYENIYRERGENLNRLLERYRIDRQRLIAEYQLKGFKCSTSLISSWIKGGYQGKDGSIKNFISERCAANLKETLDDMEELRGSHVRLEYLLAKDEIMTEEDKTQQNIYSDFRSSMDDKKLIADYDKALREFLLISLTFMGFHFHSNQYMDETPDQIEIINEKTGQTYDADSFITYYKEQMHLYSQFLIMTKLGLNSPPFNDMDYRPTQTYNFDFDIQTVEKILNGDKKLIKKLSKKYDKDQESIIHYAKSRALHQGRFDLLGIDI